MLRVELDQEDDGCWVAEIPALPGALAYGFDRREALSNVWRLGSEIVRDRLEHNEPLASWLDR